MESNNPDNLRNMTFKKLVETIIRLAVLALLLVWCFIILWPFVLVLIWAAVIAIAIYPVYSGFLKMFRNRKAWASVTLTILLLSIIIIPSWLVVDSLFQEASHLREL